MALPPLSGHASPINCTRVGCNRPATHHVIWTADIDNGLVCPEHLEEVNERWCYFALHPYEMACSMPGAFFRDALNRCVVDEEWLGLLELSVELVAP